MRLRNWVMMLAAIGVLLGAPIPAAPAESAPYGIAAYDAATGRWFLHAPGERYPTTHFYFGDASGHPVVGDWDCDGTDTVGTFRNGRFRLAGHNQAGASSLEFYFGRAGDLPMAGDWDGDGCDTVGVYRQSTGQVFLSPGLESGIVPASYYFGIRGDRPFAGDFDGDGVDTIGVYRPASGHVYLRDDHQTGFAETEFFYGRASDRFVVGDWDGNGIDSIGVIRPATGSAHLRNSNDSGFADTEFEFADADLAVAAGSLGISGPGIADGARLLPWHRVVAFYGNHKVPAMGVLGETGPFAAADRVASVAAGYETSTRPVVPAFEMIVSVAQRSAGADGDYSAPTPIEEIRPWIDVARDRGMVVVLDIQPGRSTFTSEVKRYEELLREPHVGLALDPEWRMGPNEVPGTTVGSVDASEVNEVSAWLSELVLANELPDKLFIVHQFKSTMITNRDRLLARPGLVSVLHMDGFGSQRLKLQTYSYVHVDRPWFNGFKLFYDEDTDMFEPWELLTTVHPVPDLVTYQ